MKQIVCEMCGSTELKKEDGEYICQACGTKYSVEEAKKLMVEIEGKVDVSGSSVKIDNVSEIADAINEKGSRDAKAKVRVGFILCAIAEIFLLAFGPVFYLFHTGTEDFSTMFTSEILAYICIAAFIVLFIVTLFFIINPNKLNFILFMLFIVVYLADIILSGFITRWILLMFILLLLWLPLISKNYQKIK